MAKPWLMAIGPWPPQSPVEGKSTYNAAEIRGVSNATFSYEAAARKHSDTAPHLIRPSVLIASG